MKGNKILYAGIAILILGIGFAVGTYAYYQTTVTGTVGGTVLAWECTANNQTASFTISLGSLYPGSSGEKTIDLAATIDSNFVVTFDTFTNMGAGSDHPNLKLYKDSGHATSIGTSGTLSNPNDFTVAYNSTTQKYEGHAKFYYYWPYGTASETYKSSAPSVSVTVTCTQK